MALDSPNKVLDDVYSIQLPDGDVNIVNLISEHEQESACLGLGDLMQLPNIFKSQIAKLNSQDCITLLLGDQATYSPLDPSDVEAASTETQGNVKSLGLATVRKVLQRQLSGHLGWKFTHHLIEYFLVLLKISPNDNLSAERNHDASINRWKKYKRSASFDSRKVSLFFSILSIIGTLILIYLTLRVRWLAEAASVPALSS